VILSIGDESRLVDRSRSMDSERRRGVTMLDASKAYSGFAVDDVDKAKEFYGDTLGLKASLLDVGQDQSLLQLELGDRQVLIYPKPDFTPATYTILNFPVEDVEATVDELAAKGVTFERYDGFDQDGKGIDRSGPAGGIAWFRDPAGNIMAVHGEM
jgi:catechol 2,3-dioxygenase-like lactoylglutathione lyase family enzyme